MIVPVVLVVILLILMLLLRSVVAAALLLAANVLSFGAALGVAALVFNHVLGFPGADPAVPLYAFVFLVALGVDYSIFLMTRVREESLQVGTRRACCAGWPSRAASSRPRASCWRRRSPRSASSRCCSSPSSRSSSRSACSLDTLVVRSLLVPGLVHDLGRRTWWPSAPGPRHHELRVGTGSPPDRE